MNERTTEDFLQWYKAAALETESMDFDAIKARLSDVKTIRILHAAMGLATEAGEIVDALKKHIFYGKPLNEVNLIEELGDSDWYEAIMSDALQIGLAEIKRRNIAKLRERYKGKFTEARALDRDLDAERKILEGGAYALQGILDQQGEA